MKDVNDRIEIDNEIFKSVYVSTPIPSYIWKKDKSEFYLVHYNKRLDLLSKGEIDSYLGKELAQVFGEDSIIARDIHNCYNNKLNYSKEIQYNLKPSIKNKTFIATFIYTPPKYVAVFTEDITKQKKIENILRKEEQEKSIILESISELIVYQDLNNKILWTNKAAADSVGLKIHNLIGRKCHEIWSQRDSPCVNCPITTAVKTQTPASGELYTPDGRVWLIRGSPVFNEKGELVATVEIAMEITEKRETEDKLKDSEIKYRESFNRAKFYKDLFAHDINNLLQNILSAIDLLNFKHEDGTIPEESRELLSIIKDQVIRGSNLVSNVRTLSDVEDLSFNIESVNALDVLNSVREFLIKSFHDKNVEIIINTPYDEIKIYANQLLSDLFENILINAIRYNRSEAINISINISKKTTEEGNFVKFEFIDNGIGIPDVMKAKIFQRGYNAKEFVSGLGLGLTLVKKILNLYNGAIWVQDKIDGDYTKGSNFIILIPEVMTNG